ncbi:MAG: ATP synthase subunit I [Clostridiales Family XIII bacterium]|jgi:hypothetical protein|nr:ATP synthase subunit I [Clostridiales Family XIII bacterium]
MRDEVRELTRFKNQIFLHGMIVALIFEAGALLVLGPDAMFAYGLVLGTCIAIVNFNILAITGRKLMNARRPLLSLASYVLRFCIYCMAFYMSLRLGFVSAVGTALGFFTLKLAIYYLHALKPALLKRSGKSGGAGTPAAEARDAGAREARERKDADGSDVAAGAAKDGAPFEDDDGRKRGALWKEVFGSTFDDEED